MTISIVDPATVVPVTDVVVMTGLRYVGLFVGDDVGVFMNVVGFPVGRADGRPEGMLIG